MIVVTAEITFDKSDDGEEIELTDICYDLGENKDLLELMLQYSSIQKILKIETTK